MNKSINGNNNNNNKYSVVPFMCNSKNRPTPVIKAGLWLLGLGVGGGTEWGRGALCDIKELLYIDYSGSHTTA